MKELIKTKTAVITALIVLLGVGLVSCNKEDALNPDINNLEEILGIYTGTLSYDDNLKTIIVANAEIQMNADSSIWVHCYGGDIDTTFMIDVFDHNDSVLVCLTGDDFMNEYGHGRNHQGSMMNGSGYMSGNNGMGGNMMGNNTNQANDSTGWMYHLQEEHQEGNEEHFGGFDMNNNSFSYRFRDSQNSEMYINFEGTKDQ